jgi:hypothetical protein
VAAHAVATGVHQARQRRKLPVLGEEPATPPSPPPAPSADDEKE